MTLNNMLALPMTGERAPIAITRNGAGVTARSAQISPDGKWIAYESNEEGRLEIYGDRQFHAGETMIALGAGTVR